MKRLVACVVAATFATGLACSSALPAFPRKLVILGFDGLDPDLVELWMGEGKLPNLARLAAEGGLHRLQTTPNAESASSWASFATGVNPGKHRIFDPIVRDPQTYTLSPATLDHGPARFLFNYVLLSGPTVTSRRAGRSFWVSAGHAGVRSSILFVPLTFPPEDVPNGELLAGFPAPDIGGSMATYHYFATNIAPEHAGRSEFGGVTQPLAFQAGRARAELVGPRSPLSGSGEPRELRLPFTITWNHEERSATIALDDQIVHLLERRWSRWVEVEFDVNLLARIRGLAQFYLVSAGQDLRLYVSPVHWHPSAPPSPISSPPAFARELLDRLGPYRTVSFPATAWALAEGRLDERAFMEDVEREFSDQAETILSRIDAKDWDLLVGVIDATDHAQHALWHQRDAIEHTYRRADLFVGDLLQRLDADTSVMIVSTHGFRPFRSAVNLNSWLVERGYMTLRGPVPRPRSLYDLAGHDFWQNVDWPKTRAYALGMGQVFANVKGREGQGIVSEGAEYEQLLDSLLIDLMNFLDPRTQERVVTNVYKRNDIYGGPYAGEAPDLLVTLESGYRISSQTMLGGTPARSIEANTTRWSGDHGSADHTTMHGVLITNRRPGTATVRIIDIAPSVLKHFGVAIPGDLDGRPIF